MKSSVSRKSRAAFTLVELLVATAVFLFLVLALASVSNHATNTWTRSESKSDLREAARTAANLIASDMRQAVLPLYRGDAKGLQFVINPSVISDEFKNHDAVFWQAPVATSRSKGALAVVGYFIRREGNVSKLCRLFVNPDDPDYRLRDGTGNWLSDALLDAKAPATEASDLQGIFLENVPGLWVTAYSDATTPYVQYDSRSAGKLPARVEISLAMLDKAGADRVASGRVTLPEASACPTVADFVSQLPENIRAHVQTVTINVSYF